MLLRLAEKAFAPAPLPFPLLQVATGHDFPEVLDVPRPARGGGRRARSSSPPCRRRSTPAACARPATVAQPAARRRCCSTRSPSTRFDALFGGARRDEERSRAKERVVSLRDDFGQWDPRRQRPEPWDLYNARIRPGEHLRAFPLSNWTELDVWQYVAAEGLELPVDLLRPRARGARARRHALRGLAVGGA